MDGVQFRKRKKEALPKVTSMSLVEKLTEAYQDVFANRQKEAKKFQSLLEEHEKKQIVTVEKYRYRKSASGIDDLVDLIVNSKLNLVDGAYWSKKNKQARRELALRIAGDLARSKAHKLQFARFSGEYTDHALDVYTQIDESIRNGKAMGAGTQGFLPKTAKRSGLNREAIEGGIVETHAYSIMGVKEVGETKFVIARNPWASGETIYHTLKDGSVTSDLRREGGNDGVFLIELNDFMRKFNCLYYQE